MLADGATPVPVARILTVQHTQFNHTDAGAQMHRSGAPMHRLAPAVGGNLAVLVGDFLQALLESDAGKFARLGLGCQFQLAQGRHTRLFMVHPFPFV